jgi:two-component system, sporulation sensor kinase D
VLRVIDENHTIPVIVLNQQGRVQTVRNVDTGRRHDADSTAYVAQMASRLKAGGHYIRIYLDEDHADGYIDVCYDDSLTLKRLAVYPYIQIGAVLLFVGVAVIALLTSKRAEQNRVWVGLSKETAHQLGTPISSLMAWVEILRENYPDDDLIPEMDKDVKRLQLIADRFSKIGSLPEPVPVSLDTTLSHVVDYMDRRTSRRVVISVSHTQGDQTVNLNASLFEWVIENLCKNAVDAMGGDGGKITITTGTSPKGVWIEVADTGKGIPKKDVGNVFRPGFTTKRRGWGLGLSLAKRIVEEYHHGRIYVKSSEPGVGTVFRIELRQC